MTLYEVTYRAYSGGIDRGTTYRILVRATTAEEANRQTAANPSVGEIIRVAEVSLYDDRGQ